MTDPDDLLLAWAGGFFDGEGTCCGVKTSERARRVVRPCIAVTQTMREPLDLFARLFGGSVYPAPRDAGYKPIWRWQTQARKTVGPTLVRLLPYLVVKRRVAELVLELCREPRFERRVYLAEVVSAVNRGRASALSANRRRKA